MAIERVGDKAVVKPSYRLLVALANDATKRAITKIPGWKGAAGLYPKVSDGSFGIGIRPWAYYMYYQEVGIEPFTMWALQGKLIPMKIGGKTIFRWATNVGKPGRINKRDPETGRIMSTNVGVKWRHPGLEPKNFIRDSIKETTERYKKEIKRDLVMQMARELKGETK